MGRHVGTVSTLLSLLSEISHFQKFSVCSICLILCESLGLSVGSDIASSCLWHRFSELEQIKILIILFAGCRVFNGLSTN